MEVREQANAEVPPTVECSSSEKSSVWEPEDNDAPGVPEGYTKVAESKFPIQVEEFFDLFFSDAGVNFQESFHRKCGDKEFKCTPWHPHEKFGHTRDVQDLGAVKRFRNVESTGIGKFLVP
ncbi:UNVERIFIED_CONTAM: protein VASCULAR ASSOCIATED DEATH 1, chloroplastic [Sesamum latifolium]|uniref:Protein VASCULAR ASSOCIATED DEATH 1, chloroplastic n=1 Tax=Sesamum latifolium TaxID=2727402 RepID=A0AAW2YFZ9_9LAMI